MRPFYFSLLMVYGLAIVFDRLGTTSTLLVPGVAAGFLFPGNFLVRLLGMPSSRGRDWIVAPALSPLLLGGIASLTAGGDGPIPLDLAVQATVLATGALVCLWPPRWELQTEHDAMPNRTAWVLGVALAVVIGFFLVPHEWMRLRSDALFHTAVANEIQRNGLPPQDPYFAGLSLAYFWFYHVMVLGVAGVTGVSATASMTVLNLVAAALCVPAGARLGLAMGRSKVESTWGGLLVMVGLGGLFWFFMPVKMLEAFTGEVRGTEEIKQIFTFDPWGASPALRFLQVIRSMNFFLQKFLVGTAAAWIWLVGLVTADTLFRFVRWGGLGRWLAMVILAAGGVHIHTALGGAQAMILAGAAGLAWLWRSRSPRELIAAAAMVLAVAASLPYVRAITAERTPVSPIGPDLWLWASLPVSLLGVTLLAFPVLRKLGREVQTLPTLFLTWIAAALGYALMVNLPDWNQYDKPVMTLFMPLALAAGWGVMVLWKRWRASRLRWGLVVFLVLWVVPEHLIGLSGFWAERHPPAMAPGEPNMYAWIRENTPEDAVFIDSDDRVDVIVRGQRRQYWGTYIYAITWEYDPKEMDRRRHVRDSVYKEAPLDAQAWKQLRALEEEVYVVVRDGVPYTESLRSPGFEQVFNQDQAAVVRVVK